MRKKLSGMYAFKKFSSVSKRKRDSNSTTSQLTVKEALRPTLYPKDSKKQKAITRQLALFVGSTNVPLCLVDCPEFRDLLTEWTTSTTYLIERSWARKSTKCIVIYSIISPLFWNTRKELGFVATYGRSSV